ncbi:hypothetical protein UPYG_G00100520 [Umbra pygmaea]|uniref:Uncharacterized protein n=1 Tax=Umbra pygmaea TaxID=75934 RepID=A0ABD0X4H4_UMBPY
MRDALPCLLCVAMCLPGVAACLLHQARTGGNASKDEVNVLMYGVLQFSETLHHVYQSTDAKMERINRSMRRQEVGLERLDQEAGHVAEKDRLTRQALGLLQGQMAGLESEAENAKGRLALVEQEQLELKTKVTNLETSIQNYIPTTIQELKEKVSKHSSFLEDLQERTKLQKQSIARQNRKLSKLQNLFRVNP